MLMSVNPAFCVTWILLLPLLAALCNAFLFRKTSVVTVCLVATLAVVVPFVLSVLLVWHTTHNGEVFVFKAFDWFNVPVGFQRINPAYFTVPFAFRIDVLSSVFLLFVTGVGSFIHLYSGAYMSHEENVYRFFVYLNLFVFSMLILILGSSLPVTFLGWEGVGVCSYLLVGYWHKDHHNNDAAIKAFVVNRVGDAGFLIAMFMIYKLFHSLDYVEIAHMVDGMSASQLAEHHSDFLWIGLSLFLGVTGKSAQIPLYTWLPDAMAGPTPVSALIHAATMVTAGIYLMARTNVLLVQHAGVMHTIAIVGAATALLAATMGCVHTDIKKVLAYSTCSQLGYMVMACGAGGFSQGVSHVVTHAFFKACLFLAAGSVILALHHEQDIRKMGGLFRKMPITSTAFLISTLAIIGFPGFSGFFSKDAVLLIAWQGAYGHPLLWMVGVLTVALTSFYMCRLTVLVFFGECRYQHPHHIHENNWVVTLPLVVLACAAVLGGLLCLPEAWTGVEPFMSRWLHPVLEQSAALLPLHEISGSLETGLMVISVLAMAFGALVAIFVYKKGPQGGAVFSTRYPQLYNLVAANWKVDQLYQTSIVQPLYRVGGWLNRYIDTYVIDGFVNGVPQALYWTTRFASDMHGGNVRSYMKFMVIGVCAVVFTLWCLFH